MASKCTKDAENVYATLVMASIGAQKKTLAGQTGYPYGSIDISFDPPQFSLDSTFKGFFRKLPIKSLGHI